MLIATGNVKCVDPTERTSSELVLWYADDTALDFSDVCLFASLVVRLGESGTKYVLDVESSLADVPFQKEAVVGL